MRNHEPTFRVCDKVLLDFLFISGRGSAISSDKEGKSGSIYNLVKSLIGFLSRPNVGAFNENPNHILTKLTFINP